MGNLNWHRLFGVALADFFSDLPFTVELEKDLSLRQQLLDVVVIRKGPGDIQQDLPDGLDNLADHNLITYKSLREALDEDAIEEFIGHTVNYRKQMSSTGEWLPKAALSLYAICTRFPEKLNHQVKLQRIDADRPGVYHISLGTLGMRVIVLSEIRDTPANRLWGIFSGVEAKVRQAAWNFQPKRADTSSVLDRLFAYYRLEGLAMPYTIEDFVEETMPEFIRKLPRHLLLKGILDEGLLEDIPAEERLKGLPVEERLKGLPVEERLKGLPVEERLKGLPVEERLKGLPVEERLKGLPVEERLKVLEDLPLDEIQAYLAERLKASGQKDS
ncbi:MAG: hypothetical protein SNJ67_06590 [Chloracidobacterium sp.]